MEKMILIGYVLNIFGNITLALATISFIVFFIFLFVYYKNNDMNFISNFAYAAISLWSSFGLVIMAILFFAISSGFTDYACNLLPEHPACMGKT